MVRDRVEYFESNDVLYGHNLDIIEALTVPILSEIDINDALEFSVIKRYFDKGTRSKTWPDEDYQAYKAKSRELFGITMQFFNSICDENVVEQYSTVERFYHKEFWALYANCKLYRKISNDIFRKLIRSGGISPYDLFRHKEIVQNYSDELREYLFEFDISVRILLHVYEQESSDIELLYMPAILTRDDVRAIFSKYINGSTLDANTLENIMLVRGSGIFDIGDELRLKARHKYAEVIEKISKTGVSFGYNFQLAFSLEQEEEKIAEHTGDEFKVSYSTHWLLNTLDYPSILNNFIYIFEYVDIPQMRFLHVTKQSDMGIFERISQPKSKRVYPCSSSFNFTNAMATIQMNAYYNFLKMQGIRFEDVLKWCFTEYLQEEFGCVNAGNNLTQNAGKKLTQNRR